MNKLLANWKTTGIGLTMIGGSLIHLVFAIKSKTATEGVWTASLSTIVGGCGLIFAGDASSTPPAPPTAPPQTPPPTQPKP